MRKIGIRSFQRNFYQEIENLPVVVTRKGKPFIVVDFYQEDFRMPKSTSTASTIEKKMKKIIKKKNIYMCKHGAARGLCKFGC